MHLSNINKDHTKIVAELDAEVRKQEESIKAETLQKSHHIAKLEEMLGVTKQKLKDDVQLLMVGNNYHCISIH